MTHYQEQPLVFGADAHLIGVLARPADPAPSSSVGCLMFNFGVTHRVGPRRIQVKLARQLAERGVPSLRFDLSGLGDSRMGASAGDFDEQALLDLRTAIDELQSRAGVSEVALVGLCSGAGHGLQAALLDSRIGGLISFDGHAFAGRGAKLQRRLQRLVKYPGQQLVHWAQVLLGANRPQGDLLQTGERARPVTADDFRRGMDTLVARGVVVYLLFSGTAQTSSRPYDQLHALKGADFLGKVRYEYLPHVDHSLTEVAGQASFMDAACRCIGEIEARRHEPSQPVPVALPDAVLASPASAAASRPLATAF